MRCSTDHVWQFQQNRLAKPRNSSRVMRPASQTQWHRPIGHKFAHNSTSAAGAVGFGTPEVELGPPEENPVVPPVPDLYGKRVRRSWNATALAYLGDSVWELYCRRHYFFPPTRLTDYYDNVTAQVRAEQQDMYFELLSSTPFLTDDERDVLRWGRNAKVSVPKRFTAVKSGEVYRKATAIECLAGYLYLTDPPRLHQLMVHLGLGGGVPLPSLKDVHPSPL